MFTSAEIAEKCKCRLKIVLKSGTGANPPGYMDWFMGPTLETEFSKTFERVEEGLKTFESKANDVGMFSNVNQLQTHIVRCLQKCDLNRAAKHILTKYCISHF